MRLNALILIAVVGVSIGFSYLMQAGGPVSGKAPQEQPAINQNPAPDFPIADIRGRTYKLSDFSGRVILLNFWASWCAPCVVELPQMLKLAQENEQKIVFIGISIDENRNNLDLFLKRNVPDLSATDNVIIIHDNNRGISRNIFGTIRVPETIIIDPAQNMVRKIIGADIDWGGNDMREYLLGLF